MNGKHYPEGVKPRICPTCNKEYFFYCDCETSDKMYYENKCTVCRHEWTREDKSAPLECPRCHRREE